MWPIALVLVLFPHEVPLMALVAVPLQLVLVGDWARGSAGFWLGVTAAAALSSPLPPPSRFTTLPEHSTTNAVNNTTDTMQSLVPEGPIFVPTTHSKRWQARLHHEIPTTVKSQAAVNPRLTYFRIYGGVSATWCATTLFFKFWLFWSAVIPVPYMSYPAWLLYTKTKD